MAKRRANKEGTVYYDKANKLWYCAMTVNGKQRKTRGSKTQQQALEALQRLRQEHDGGIDITMRQPTVRAFFERYLEDLIKPARAPKTYRSYRQLADLYILPEVGDCLLNEVKTPHLQRLLNVLNVNGGKKEQGLGENTIAGVRRLLIQALNVAVDWDLLLRNVALKTQMPEARKPPREMTPLSERQAQQLLQTAAGDRLEPLYRIALTTGQREGEILGLLRSEIDWERGTIKVSGQIQRINRDLDRYSPRAMAANGDEPQSKSVLVRRPYPKNKKPRIIALSAEQLCELRQYLERLDEERALLGERWQDHDLVFPSEVGTPMDPRNLVRNFKSLLKKAGLQETIRFHDLRHSAATIMLGQGVPLTDVSATLGHSSIQITADIYDHPDDQRIANATSAADQAIQRGSRKKKEQ